MSKFRAIIMLFLAFLAAAPVRALTPEEQQAKEFRAELNILVKELESGKDEDFIAALDKVSAVKDAADGIDPSETAFLERAKVAAEDVGHELLRKTHQCGQSVIVRTRSEGDSTFALVRLDYGDTSWGWVDMELAPALDGSMRIVDLLNYSTGMNYVETVRQAAAPQLTREDSVAKLYRIPASKGELARKLAGLLKQLREGDYDEAVQAWNALPADYRVRKEVALLGLQASALAGSPSSYARIMQEIAGNHPRDPLLDLMLAEYHFSQDEHQEALNHLEAFEKLGVDRDATIFAMKANALTALGKASAGLALAKKAVQLEPNIQDGYWAVLMAQCTEGDCGGAVETAKALEEKFDYKLDEDALSRSVVYEKLVKSKEYLKWREEVDER